MAEAGNLWPQPGEGDIEQPGVVSIPPIVLAEGENMPPGVVRSSPNVLSEDVVLPPPGMGFRNPGEPYPQSELDSPPGAVLNHRKDDDARLRTFLVKQGLTSLQVDEVLRINRGQRNVRRFSQPALSRSRKKALRRKAAPGAPGVPKANNSSVKIFSILMPSKQIVGRQLIKEFLASEKEYCAILECLKDDYYLVIAEKADQGKFLITRSQVDDIFRPVVELVMLHRGFYSDLYTGSSITQLSFFRVYTQYIRNCTSTINNMRGYAKDDKLNKCLSQIKQKSRRQKDEMVDLLLKPLDRIIEYKHFFKKLCSFADKTQTAEYDFLVRASKSISRAATYIEQYKCGIRNRSEMNKIQRFLGDQCNVFGAKRSIIRQGKMYSQTKGWASRNKRYIFFLFTDILLWTTKKGELQNAVYLTNCRILPSFAKSNPERKFQIEFSEQMHKPLLLECTSQQHRNEWYVALTVAVEAARNAMSKSWKEAEGLSDEKKRDEDIIAPKGFPKNIANREEGESPVNFVDELNYVGGLDASSSGAEDYGFNRFGHQQNSPNHELDCFESIHDFSSENELRLGKPHSAPICAFDDRNNPAAELKAAFRRAVIMSPQLRKSASDGINGAGSFSIRRNSFNSRAVHRNSPTKDAARLSRVDEENRISEMEEKDIEYSKSISVQHYHKRNRSIIRRLSQTEEVRSPPSARRRSLYSRISKPKKGIRRRSFQPGAQPSAQPGAQPKAQPGAPFFKISLNDFNER